MFWVIDQTRTKIMFDTIDAMFAYVNASNETVEGFAGYQP